MSKEHHEWRIGQPLPEIRPHSLAKHRVIEQYLMRYVDVLTADLRIPEFRITLVDGFAGGGLYRDSETDEQRLGSPLLMLRAMRESAAVAQARRSKDFRLDVEYFFVEESSGTFPVLRASIQDSDFRILLPDKINLLNDTFTNQVDSIISHIQSRRRGNRAIFLLDQFGYSAVPFHSIRSIMSKVRNAEVILTFAVDSLIDYLSEKDSMQKTLGDLGLELNKELIRSAKQTADWRCAIQVFLHQQIFAKSGAKHYTPFFIRSKDAHRDYWLIHLSNHWRARDVMVGLHWAENTNFAHYGKPGLVMLGYDQDFDTRITGQPFLFDQCARSSTHECLLNELPERIHALEDWIPFSKFIAMFTDETPATSEHFKTVLAAMLNDGTVEIRDETGHVRRQSGIQRHSDLLRASKQGSLFIPGGA